MRTFLTLLLTGLCCLPALPTFAQNTIKDTGQGSAYAEFYKMEKAKDYTAIKAVLSGLRAQYSHFIPTKEGVSVYHGPEINSETHGALVQSVKRGPQGRNQMDISNLRHIKVDTALPWVGGIVNNKVLPGDAQCSGWHEVLTLDMTWLAWNDTNPRPNYVGAEENIIPAYVCADHIKKRPLSSKDNRDLKMAQLGVYEESSTMKFTRFTVRSGMSIPQGRNEPAYTTKSNDILAVAESPRKAGATSQGSFVDIYLALTKNDYVKLGQIPFSDLSSIPFADTKGRIDVTQFITRNKNTFRR